MSQLHWHFTSSFINSYPNQNVRSEQFSCLKSKTDSNHNSNRWTDCLTIQRAQPESGKQPYLMMLSCVQTHLWWQHSRSMAHTYSQVLSLRSSPNLALGWNSVFGHNCMVKSSLETMKPTSTGAFWQIKGKKKKGNLEFQMQCIFYGWS